MAAGKLRRQPNGKIPRLPNGKTPRSTATTTGCCCGDCCARPTLRVRVAGVTPCTGCYYGGSNYTQIVGDPNGDFILNKRNDHPCGYRGDFLGVIVQSYYGGVCDPENLVSSLDFYRIDAFRNTITGLWSAALTPPTAANIFVGESTIGNTTGTCRAIIHNNQLNCGTGNSFKFGYGGTVEIDPEDDI